MGTPSNAMGQSAGHSMGQGARENPVGQHLLGQSVSGQNSMGQNGLGQTAVGQGSKGPSAIDQSAGQGAAVQSSAGQGSVSQAVLPATPCGACKFLRRKCTATCVFALHFAPDQTLKFANVHRIFGASNVGKLLEELPAASREDAVSSLSYEAEARINDPVYGCVGALFALQQQVRLVACVLRLVTCDLRLMVCDL